MTVVDEAGRASLVDEHLRWHAAQLEEVHFLAVALQHRVRRIGQADEGQRVVLPVARECAGVLGAYHDDLDIALHELRVGIAQLRHVPSAERSNEGAVEDQEHVLAVSEVRETHRVAGEVGECEIRSDGIQGYSGHVGLLSEGGLGIV